MVDNLRSRGCPLLGIFQYPSLKLQYDKYINIAGFDHLEIADMNQVYDKIGEEEKRRVSKLEIFDEFEEWNLMQSHYFIAVASKSIKADDFSRLTSIWGT